MSLGHQLAKLSLLILLVGSTAAHAATRVALLIGESDYYKPPPTVHGYFWPKLENPSHDVKLVAGKLREIGFDTTMAVNVNRAAMLKAVADFAVKAAQADDAVVYYAGHGFEFNRHNYLVPTDAPVEVSSGQLDQVYVDLDVVVRAAGKARRVNIFFLDACRDGGKLVRLNGPSKPYVDDLEFRPGLPVAVLYSAARGDPAFDRGISAPPPKEYSPFAWFVAQFLTLPRTSLGDFFTFVNAKVQDSTRKWGPQSPYILSSLTEVFYFRPAGVLAPRPPGGSVAATTQSVTPPPRVTRGLAQSLDISMDYLAVTDEPVVVAQVLNDHSLEDVAALAEAGDPLAAYILGYMFEFGRGAQLDLKQARVWLEHAAASGLAPAQLEYGWFLQHHSTDAADLARARTLFEASAAQGFAKAQAHLADLLMRSGTAADYDRGLELYQSAASKNYPQAIYALAVLKDKEARKQLAQLASAGDTASRQWHCELAASDGMIGLAFSDCTAAAKAGYAISQARLAIAYHDGNGVQVDNDEARHWTRLALGQPDLRDDLRQTLLSYPH